MEVTQSFPPKRQLNTYDAKLPPGCTGYDQAWMALRAGERLEEWT